MLRMGIPGGKTFLSIPNILYHEFDLLLKKKTTFEKNWIFIVLGIYFWTGRDYKSWGGDISPVRTVPF